MIYCDTSYLLRLYLDDPGSDEVRALCRVHPIASAGHARAELPAALHRAFREQRISPQAFAAQIAQFNDDCASGAVLWHPLPPSLLASMSSRYAKLPPRVFLRAADALHLACAAEHGYTEVYSNDKHFLAAAPLFGLQGLNVIPA
jgi:predicted nucleic acid-binding protein